MMVMIMTMMTMMMMMMTTMMMIMTVDGVRALNWILAGVGWLVKGLNCDLLPWDGRDSSAHLHSAKKTGTVCKPVQSKLAQCANSAK